MRPRRIAACCLFFLALTGPGEGRGAVYFYWDGEDQPCGRELPNPPFWTQQAAHRGRVACGPTPQGKKYFEWLTGDRWHDHYTEIHQTQGLPVACRPGKTYYLAYFFNFSRIAGREIWRRTGDSADKGIEIVGSGVRWLISRGTWSSLAGNRPQRYSVWGGNPTYHLNRRLEANDILPPNRSGYSARRPIQLEYERWYGAVMAVKLAPDASGSFAFYIDGRPIAEYDRIQTAAHSSPTIHQITLGGTIAQPAYDALAHRRMFDALLLTDDWLEVENGGYLKGGPPSRPAGEQNPARGQGSCLIGWSERLIR